MGDKPLQGKVKRILVTDSILKEPKNNHLQCQVGQLCASAARKRLVYLFTGALLYIQDVLKVSSVAKIEAL